MSELTLDRFPEFFEAVTEYEPFAWQIDLTARLLRDDFPQTIDVPTGLGKTSVIHCWAYALAAQVEAQRRVPLRIFFIVDRRLVVDGTHKDALLLANKLTDSTAGILGRVANNLALLHRATAPPLTVVRMRGGVSWESRWLARPDQAAVVVGTVDQFGSRLLFRGYGVSPSMRPIDAALVGFDSWLVLDEAHISEPLAKTVDSVIAHQRHDGILEGKALRATRMSATVESGGSTLRADLDAQTDPSKFPRAAGVAHERINATKPAGLVDLGFLETASRKQWRKKSQQLGQALAKLARTVSASERVIGLVANTISTARAAHEHLEAQGEDAILLIGRVRGYERDRNLADWLPKIEVGAPRNLERRLFVVATQTIEVGANLDLDTLVTECAPLPAVIQRFGRVNRLGRRQAGKSLIVHAGFAHDEDLIYGPATSATWRFLKERAEVVVIDNAREIGTKPPCDEIDFGIRAARGLPRAAKDSGIEVIPKPPFMPVVLGAHFERWAMTNPAPHPDQPVAPFLHGVNRFVPEISVAWRAAPPDPGSEKSWQQWLDLVPPVEWEMVPIPIWEMRSFLAEQAGDLPVADLEGVLDLSEEPEAPTETEVVGAVYRGRREPVKLVRGPHDVSPGDRLILQAHVGGHDAWGWTGRRTREGERPVPDVGDLAPTRRRGVLRLTPGVFATWAKDEEAEAAVNEVFSGLDPSEPETVQLTLAALSEAPIPDDLADVVKAAGGEDQSTLEWEHYAADLRDGNGAIVLMVEPSEQGSDSVSDEDEISTSQTSQRTTLSSHGAAVGEMARQFAENLGMPTEVHEAVELAGRWHDLGKADERFQVALHDGDRLAALAAVEPLAKSGHDPRDPMARRAWSISGLPRGFRHEAVSARLVDELITSRPPLDQSVNLDLVRHLVVSHHGKARPLLPAVLDPEAPTVTIATATASVSMKGATSQVDWAQPGHFESLCRHYGWWGLAYLETLVRLADMLCSEQGR